VLCSKELRRFTTREKAVDNLGVSTGLRLNFPAAKVSTENSCGKFRGEFKADGEGSCGGFRAAELGGKM
jgi:hypothetical protein